MSEVIELVEDDVNVKRYFQIIEKNDASAKNIVGKTITARLRLKNASTTLWQDTCNIIQGTTGLCELVFDGTELDLTAGSRYEIQIYVNSGSDIETVLDLIDIKIIAKFAAVT